MSKTEKLHLEQTPPQPRRKSWRFRSSDEIAQVIQGYADPANDANLTRWSARRLVGAMLRLDSTDLWGLKNEPIKEEVHLYKDGTIGRQYYSGWEKANVVKKQYELAPVRRTFRPKPRRKLPDQPSVEETEITQISYGNSPVDVIKSTRVSGIMIGDGARFIDPDNVDETRRELIKQEVLLWGKLEYPGQKKPKWLEVSTEGVLAYNDIFY